MAKTTDDLEAVRIVAAALAGFSAEDQERIIRWAREKLGLASGPQPTVLDARSSPPAGHAITPHPAETPKFAQQSPPLAKDVKTFVTGKKPKNDMQFAATVAYFYRFEAPTDQRRDEIDRIILQDACRLVGRERFTNPLMTLNNAKKQGVLDSGSEAGKFAINTVGENLVAMTLPGQTDIPTKIRKPRKSTSKPTKKK